MFWRKTGGAWHASTFLSRNGGAYSTGPQTLRKTAGIWAGDATLVATAAPTTLASANAAAGKTTAAATATPTGAVGGVGFTWSKVSGGAITIDSPGAASTTFTAAALADGEVRSAVFRCKVTDALGHVANSNNVTVTVSRWSQPTLTAPGTASASGTAATETTAAVAAVVANGTAPFAYSWTKLSGGAVTATAPAAAATLFTATGLASAGEARSATFRCTVTDAHGLTAVADVVVTLTRLSTPQLSAPSLASAQTNGATAATGNVTATVAGGTAPYAYKWTKLSGDVISIGSSTAATTNFSAASLTAGETRSATFRCTVTDANGLTATADVDVSISRYAALTAGESPGTLSGSAASATVTTSGFATANGNGGLAPYGYAWSRVSGSTGISPVSTGAASTKFTSTTVPAGGSQSAVFKCTVTDSLGQSVASANVTITLNNTSSTGGGGGGGGTPATYSPAPGTYNVDDGGSGSASFAASASATVTWTWSASSTTGLGASVPSGGSATAASFTLSGGLHGRSASVTLQSGGKTWIINLTATGAAEGGGGTA